MTATESHSIENDVRDDCEIKIRSPSLLEMAHHLNTIHQQPTPARIPNKV